MHQAAGPASTIAPLIPTCLHLPLVTCQTRADPRCENAWKEARKWITVGGIKKGSSVWYEPAYGGKMDLKLGRLNLDARKVQAAGARGVQMTVRASDDNNCDDVNTFFVGNRTIGALPVQHAFAESSVNE